MRVILTLGRYFTSSEFSSHRAFCLKANFQCCDSLLHQTCRRFVKMPRKKSVIANLSPNDVEMQDNGVKRAGTSKFGASEISVRRRSLIKQFCARLIINKVSEVNKKFWGP